MKEAKAQLGLDAVWMLPVPLSTLKKASDVAPFERRVHFCEVLVENEDWIKVSDIEQDVGTNQTIDTVRYLKEHFPEHDFVWLMGTDSFASVHEWGVSSDFINEIKTAVFSRTEGEDEQALSSKTAQKMQPLERNVFWAHDKGWIFVEIPPHPARATGIRQRLRERHRSEDMPERLRDILQEDDFYVKT